MPRETQIVGRWCYLGDSSTASNQCCRSKLHNPHVRAPDGAKVMLKTELMQMLRREFALDWGGIHGSPHWARVRLNGLQTARENGARLDVVECFALLHDSQRMHDGKDGNHGARAADYARRINRDLLHTDTSPVTHECGPSPALSGRCLQAQHSQQVACPRTDAPRFAYSASATITEPEDHMTEIDPELTLVIVCYGTVNILTKPAR